MKLIRLFSAIGISFWLPAASAQLLQDYMVDSQLSAMSLISCWPNLECVGTEQRWITDGVTNSPGTVSTVLEGPEPVRAYATASVDWAVDTDADSASITAEMSGYYEAVSIRSPSFNGPTFSANTHAGLIYDAGFTLTEGAYYQFESIAEFFYLGFADPNTPTQPTGGAIFVNDYSGTETNVGSSSESGYLAPGSYAFGWWTRAPDSLRYSSQDEVTIQTHAMLDMRFSRTPFKSDLDVPEINRAGAGIALGLVVAAAFIRREKKRMLSLA